MPSDIPSVSAQSGNSFEEVEKAKRFVASCAIDGIDATLLLDMLGLIPPHYPIVELSEGKKRMNRERNARRRQK